MHIRLVSWILVFSLFGLPLSVLASDDRMHRLLAHEHYAEARELALAACDATRDGDVGRHLAAWLDLLDVAIAQREVRTVEVGEWLDKTVQLLEAHVDPEDPRWIKPLAVRVFRIAHRVDPAQPEVALRLKKLLEAERQASATASDREFAWLALGVVAANDSRFEEAAQAQENARAVLAKPQGDWQRVRHALAEVLYGSYAERAMRADALAVAEAGAAEIEHVCGADCLQYAFARMTIAQARYFRGDVLGARADLEIALPVLRRWPDRRSDLGFAISLYAHTLRTLGDLNSARDAYLEAIRLAETEQTRNPATLSARLNGLGSLERMAGRPGSARERFEQALSALAPAGESADRHRMPIYVNLGELDLYEGHLETAEVHARHSAEIGGRVYGPHHANTLVSHRLLGLVALHRGDSARAVSELAPVVTDLEAQYGSEFPSLQPARCLLALAKARTGKDDEAWDMALLAERQRIAEIRRVAPVLSDGQMLAFKNGETMSCGGLVLALAMRNAAPERVAVAWQLVGETRGLTTRLKSERLAMAREATDTAGRERWQQWERAARLYADALLFGSPADIQNLEKAQQALVAAEKSLGAPALVRAGIDPVRFDLTTALAARPLSTAIVAYWHADDFNLSETARGVWLERDALYAFVQPPGAVAMKLVALGPSAVREAEAGRWYRALRNPALGIPELMAAGEVVRRNLWDPLGLPFDAGSVFIVPDDAVFRLNFAALPVGDGFAVEHGARFHQLDNERDLLGPPASVHRSQLVLVGAPDFGRPAPACRDGLPSLTGADEELRRVAALWPKGQSVRLSGSAASKTALRDAAGHADVLHLATHTVRLDAGCPATTAVRGAAVVGGEHVEEPLQVDRVALALAGANHYFADGSHVGLLSVPEILALPLDGTRRVVLAACDSGTGPVLPEEGVFGLRRAFRLAGARAVVMSLWAVDDTASVAWMEAFYRASAAPDGNLISAVSAASLDVITERQRTSQSTHPYFWAAYVAAGDWR